MADPNTGDPSGSDPIDLEPVDDAAPAPKPGPETPFEPEPELETDPTPEVVEVTITEPRGKQAEEDEPINPLVRPGLGGARLALIVGAILLLSALVASGIRAGGLENTGARVVALAIAVTLFQSLLHTGTGVAAIMFAARLERRPTGALELAAARMLACVGAFQLVYHLPTLVPGIFGYVIASVLGLLAYAGAVWGLFRLTRLELGVVVSGHIVLLLGVALGTHLTHLYRSAVDTASVITP